MENTDDNKLIVAFRHGDQEGFNHVYDLHKYQLYQFIHNLVSDSQEAEDILANCFVKVWEKRATFLNFNSIRAFLYVIAKNACINHFRHQKVINKSQKELAFLLENENFIETRMIEAEVLGQIYAEIENLPPQCKKIFKMLYLQGLNYGKIAAELNLDESTVRRQKMIAIKRLRARVFKNEIPISALIVFFSTKL